MKVKKPIQITKQTREAFKAAMHKHLEKCGLNTSDIKKMDNDEFMRVTGLPYSYEYLALAYNGKNHDPSVKAFTVTCEFLGLVVLPMETIVKPFRLPQ